jgi:hypothetical protein
LIKKTYQGFPLNRNNLGLKFMIKLRLQGWVEMPVSEQEKANEAIEDNEDER